MKMKRVLTFLCLILVCWSLVGISHQSFVKGNPFDFQRAHVILLTPEQIIFTLSVLEPQHNPFKNDQMTENAYESVSIA